MTRQNRRGKEAIARSLLCTLLYVAELQRDVTNGFSELEKSHSKSGERTNGRHKLGRAEAYST